MTLRARMGLFKVPGVQEDQVVPSTPGPTAELPSGGNEENSDKHKRHRRQSFPNGPFWEDDILNRPFWEDDIPNRPFWEDDILNVPTSWPIPPRESSIDYSSELGVIIRTDIGRINVKPIFDSIPIGLPSGFIFGFGFDFR